MNKLDLHNNANPNEIENPTKFVALSTTFTALVFIATAIFQLAITATNGYFNFGEAMVYLAALIGGPLVGLVAGAVGSSLSDIITGYGIYAPGTFVVKGIEGYVAGYLFFKLRHLNKDQIKSVYVAFTSIFLGLAVILTTPSLWSLFGNLVAGKIDIGNFPFDIGSYVFTFSIVFYVPQINSFNLANLQNFIVWNQPPPININIPGFLILILTILGLALIWIGYHYYGERSKIIVSCASGGFFMVIGYLLYEMIILGLTLAQVLGEFPFNVLQVIIGIMIALPTYVFLLNSGIISETNETTETTELTEKKAEQTE